LGFVLGALCSTAALSYARDKGMRGSDCLSEIAPTAGFRYFSGNAQTLHNHPAMYASGSEADAKLTVVGIDHEAGFPVADPDAAFAAYRALLVERGYLPTPP
jgi:hypothetical protein